MKKFKLEYEAPEAHTFVVRFEGSLLTGSPFGKNDFAGTDMSQRIIDEEY